MVQWVQDITQQAACSTPIKIASPHHFNPASVDPKEFKNKQQAIKVTHLMIHTIYEIFEG